MTPTLDACLRSWPFDPWLWGGLLLVAVIYFRGWCRLHRGDATRWDAGRIAAFLGGLAAVYLALASPIEPFASLLLQVHMLQHLLLMMVAPPLLWLGSPFFPLLRGLPEPVRTYWVAPLFRQRMLRRLFESLTHPFCALPIFVGTTWFWHIPAIYETALRSSTWHYVQHVCFLTSALLFWYPVVRPYPSRPRWSTWLLFPYLLFADVQNTILSALLTFSHQPLYPYYTQVPRLGGISAINDQAAAGVLMWVPGSVAYLLPLFAISVRLLYAGSASQQRGRSPRRVVNRATSRLNGSPFLPILADSRTGSRVAPLRSAAGFDLLRLPLLGAFLKWRHSRLAMQIPLCVLAGVVILDGLRGPQVGPMNLAGVLPWIHWRGLLMFGLLAIGNIFCMACPFTLPRSLARRWWKPARQWPRQLQSKWLAVCLLALFLWSYEAFSLWDSPGLTAWIAIGYFVGAFFVDRLFEGAAFCKYVCPIGQFNFVQSLAAPVEIGIRSAELCTSCRTKDCIRGRDNIPGCEMQLVVPRKADNFDCTLCLDCLHTCPHENIGLLAGFPGRSLWNASLHGLTERLAIRLDIAALVMVLVCGAFANAAGMVGPVLDWQDRLVDGLGGGMRLAVVGGFYFGCLVLLPLVAMPCLAWWSRRLGRLPASLAFMATRYAFAFVPLGFGMWLAHYSFHLLTSYDTAIPTAQRFAAEWGWTGLGKPAWAASCCRPVGDWLPKLEILFLECGLLLSLYVAFRLGRADAGPGTALKTTIPWALALGLLFAAGVWIILQPMQMRGTLPGAG